MEDAVSSGPPRIQIQTQTGCNGRCVFCPNAGLAKTGAATGRMPFNLFVSIVDQLAETKPRRIMPYLQNEPLLDDRLPEFVRYVSERLPSATSLVVTNGVRLTPEMGERLIEARLKRLKVSLQSIDDATNRKIMGFEAHPVIENVLNFRRLLASKRSKLDLRISMIVTSENYAEIDAARRFWRKYGIRLVTSVLENRGGNIAEADSLNRGQKMARRENCIRPSRDLCVLFDGRVILCCADWFQTTVIGDLTRQSVRDVWNSRQLKHIREALRMPECCHLPEICSNCAESRNLIEHRHARGAWHQLRESFAELFGKALG